jgi:hypothetical protein
MTSNSRQAFIALTSFAAFALLMAATAEAKDLQPGGGVPVGAKSIVAPKAPRGQDTGGVLASSNAGDKTRQIVVEENGKAPVVQKIALSKTVAKPVKLAELKETADAEPASAQDAADAAPAPDADPSDAASADEAPAPEAPAAEAPAAPAEAGPAEQQQAHGDDSTDTAAAYAYLYALYKAAHHSHGYGHSDSYSYSYSHSYSPSYDDCE